MRMYDKSPKFVEKAIDITDRIVEAYQGAYKTIELKDDDKNIKLENIRDKDIVSFLKKMKKFIAVDFTNILDSNANHDLLNLRDEMLENIDITLYLFGFE